MTQSTVLPTPTNGKEASKPQTEGPPPPGAPTEVVPRARRRSFTAEYKRRILQEADSCTQSSQVPPIPNGLCAANPRSFHCQKRSGSTRRKRRKKKTAILH